MLRQLTLSDANVQSTTVVAPDPKQLHVESGFQNCTEPQLNRAFNAPAMSDSPIESKVFRLLGRLCINPFSLAGVQGEAAAFLVEMPA